MRPKPFLLLILDGWGIAPPGEGNAIALAKTPVFDRLASEFPFTTLCASGPAVGLPEGQMGNSEVGHLNIGAGRIVRQDFERINLSIRDGSFERNPVINEAITHARNNGSRLHLVGLLSNGGVHSHIDHLKAVISLARKKGLRSVVTHAFLDGRDVPPRSALEWIEELERISADGVGKIKTLGGRYYGMDRDNRWDRIKLAYDAIVHGAAPVAPTAAGALEESYVAGVDDEFLLPRVIGEPVAVSPTDSVFFFNFRPDRARELTHALSERGFHRFDRGEAVFPALYTMTSYDEALLLPAAFPPEQHSNVLADVLAANGLTQLHLAETEKYAHVTYFFNGGDEERRPGEERILVPSPKVKTYDLQPEMSAPELTAVAEEKVASGLYDFIVMNYANCDMVGHTGHVNAAISAVETVDTMIGRMIESAWRAGGEAVITADHGNAENMLNEGMPCTAHSLADVPFIHVTRRPRRLRDEGILGDIAPTILEAMDIPAPNEMTGRSLFAK